MLSRLKSHPSVKGRKERRKSFLPSSTAQARWARGIQCAETTGRYSQRLFPNERTCKTVLSIFNKIKRNEKVAERLSLGLFGDLLQRFDWALQVGCVSSYRKFRLTLTLGLLEREIEHHYKLRSRVTFQMVCLGFA